MKRPDFERCLCATEYSDGRTMFEDDYQNIMHIWSSNICNLQEICRNLETILSMEIMSFNDINGEN